MLPTFLGDIVGVLEFLHIRLSSDDASGDVFEGGLPRGPTFWNKADVGQVGGCWRDWSDCLGFQDFPSLLTL